MEILECQRGGGGRGGGGVGEGGGGGECQSFLILQPFSGKRISVDFHRKTDKYSANIYSAQGKTWEKKIERAHAIHGLKICAVPFSGRERHLYTLIPRDSIATPDLFLHAGGDGGTCSCNAGYHGNGYTAASGHLGVAAGTG